MGLDFKVHNFSIWSREHASKIHLPENVNILLLNCNIENMFPSFFSSHPTVHVTRGDL
jgi:hypothetical protein